MPSARVPRPGSSSHVGISWERGEKDGASGPRGMGRGRGSIEVLIQRVQRSAWDRGSHTIHRDLYNVQPDAWGGVGWNSG